jgi:hypothetical protein
MTDEKGDEYEIFFSGIAGEKCTYRMRTRRRRSLVRTGININSILICRMSTGSTFERSNRSSIMSACCVTPSKNGFYLM